MQSETRPEKSERRGVLKGLLSLGGYLAVRPFVASGSRETRQWLEIVQDRNNPSHWYVNLYEGPTTGDLGKGVLKGHRIELGDLKSLRTGTLPRRIWYSSGEREQDF